MRGKELSHNQNSCAGSSGYNRSFLVDQVRKDLCVAEKV